MISESPASVIDKTPTRKYLPQAVPRSILSIIFLKKNIKYFYYLIYQFYIIIFITYYNTKFSLTSIVVVDTGLRKHSVVFEFRLSEWWAVTGDDN